MARLVAKKKKVVEKQESNKSLMDIMDYKEPFELIYSGVESEGYFNVLYDCGIRDFLMSYHYLQKTHTNMEKRFGDGNIRLFIDSGAHTYQQDPKYEEVTIEEWEQHLQKYLRWLEKNKKYIFAAANFDFENMLGADIVAEWNRKYFEPFMLRTGIPICFVWHQNSAYDWESYCQRYPYIGFSSVNIVSGENIDLTDYKEKLRIAEKHGALVHGFGMTRTGMLTELPFYTVDSTTWMVGLQYGELNYWTGTKMTRLKKDKWQGKMLSVICGKYGLDEDLMLKEDTKEVIKANIFAFKDAVEFIQHHLKGMMYWLKAKAVVNDVNNLPADFYPSEKWLLEGEHDSESEKGYAIKMNINPEYESAGILVENCTMLMNWNNTDYGKLQETYESDDFDVLKATHDFLINKVRETTDEMVSDLQEFFRECIEGKNDRLLHIGTNFDRQQKEREHYIEDDDERELVPMSLEQVRKDLSAYLPAPNEGEGAPEIDELDAEIFAKADIVPTFDEHGKFVKGQKSVRAPKRVYSNKYPKLACSNCFMAAKCSEYKDGYVCAYNKMFDRFDTRNMGDIIEAMQGIVGHGMKRLQIAMMFEMMNGNIDQGVTGLMDNTIKNLNFLKDIYENASSEVIKQTRIIRPDGSMEENTSVHNPRSGGILEKIFGGMGGEKDVHEEVQREKVYGQKNNKKGHSEKNIDEEAEVIDAEFEEI